MKKFVAGVAALMLLPLAAQAQTPQSGVYIGAEGGLNWLLNNGSNSYDMGWAAGGKIGYDFVGPRVELEGIYRNNRGNGPATFGGNISGQVNQISAMANLLYDFAPGATITPYIGAGAGIAFADPSIASSCSMCSTQFAYQGILGVAYNFAPNMALSLDGRYYGTSNPGNYQNNNISVMLGLTYKFASAETVVAPPPAAPAPQATSFLVFFDWDRSDLSSQAQATISQAAQAYKTKGSARITATWDPLESTCRHASLSIL